MRTLRVRPGFTLIEMLVALTLTAIIGAAITLLFVSQERAFDTQTKLQSARDVTRGARNIITSELRMLERDSGVVAASADSLELRVPYAMGVACGMNSGPLVALQLPVDSAMADYAAYAGYAVRDFATGTYLYEASTTAPDYSTAASDCATNQITVAGGRRVALSPPPAAVTPGSPVLLWQVVRYYFGESEQVPGRRALYRELVGSAAPEEIVAPFADSAHFEFYVDDALAPVTTAPTDLDRLTGIELVLDAVSERADRDGSYPLVRLRTAVFFKNRRN